MSLCSESLRASPFAYLDDPGRSVTVHGNAPSWDRRSYKRGDPHDTNSKGLVFLGRCSPESWLKVVIQKERPQAVRAHL